MQVILPTGAEDQPLPSWFFSRSPAELKTAFVAKQKKRELDQVGPATLLLLLLSTISYTSVACFVAFSRCMVPTVDWALLATGDSNKGWESGKLYLLLACLQTHLASFGRNSV